MQKMGFDRAAKELQRIVNNNNGQASWSADIVPHFKALGFTGNWLDIRGVLQAYIDQGLLTRTADVHNEIYTTE